MNSLQVFSHVGSFLGHGRHQIHVHQAATAHHFSPLLVASAIAITILAMLSLAGFALLLAHVRRNMSG